MATIGFHFALVLEQFGLRLEEPGLLLEEELDLARQTCLSTPTWLHCQADLSHMPLGQLDYLAVVAVAVETGLAQVAQLESLPRLLGLARPAFLRFALHSTGQHLIHEHLWHGHFDSESWHWWNSLGFRR